MAAKYVNDIEIAKAQRDFELKNATFDQEVQTKKAQSEMAYALQVHSYNFRFVLRVLLILTFGSHQHVIGL